MSEFTHLDARGQARMVDVTAKPVTQRKAVARSKVTMRPETLERFTPGDARGLEIMQTARIAAVLAAKQTSQLIPLCHSLPVAPLTIDFHAGADHIAITATAQTYERTGVEMEALMGCSIAALSLYASCRSSDDTMSVDDIALWEKIGGKSGHWQRDTSLPT